MRFYTPFEKHMIQFYVKKTHYIWLYKFRYMNLLRMYYPLTGKFINDTFNFYCIRLITQVTEYTQHMQLGNI